jgi:hypothetical protein
MSTPPVPAPDQLDTLLTRWAAVRRLDDKQANALHAAIVQRAAEQPPAEVDADWLWGLLRPVTSLLDGPNPFYETLSGLISVGA